MGDQVDNVFPLNSEILPTANILLSLKTLVSIIHTFRTKTSLLFIPNELYQRNIWRRKDYFFSLIFNNWYIDFGKTLRPNHHTNHYFFSKLNGIIYCYEMVKRKDYLIPKLTILTWRMYYEPLNNNNFIFGNIKLYLLNELKKQINNWIFQVFKAIFAIKWLDLKW